MFRRRRRWLREARFRFCGGSRALSTWHCGAAPHGGLLSSLRGFNVQARQNCLWGIVKFGRGGDACTGAGAGCAGAPLALAEEPPIEGLTVPNTGCMLGKELLLEPELLEPEMDASTGVLGRSMSHNSLKLSICAFCSC